MSVDDVYKIMQFVINKNQNGYLTPDDFNLVINQASINQISFLIGNVEQFQYGKGQPRIQYSISENIRQKLQPFIKTVTLSVTSGSADYPDDFLLTDTMMNNDGISRIRYAENNKLYSFLGSVIDPIETNPIYVTSNTGFTFYPNTITDAKLTYVSKPTAIVWAYTLDDNGRPVYNAGASVDPQWYDTDIYSVIARALRMLGVNLKDNEVSQYAETIKNGGV